MNTSDQLQMCRRRFGISVDICIENDLQNELFVDHSL